MAAAKLSFASQGKSHVIIILFNTRKADLESDRPDHRLGKMSILFRKILILNVKLKCPN